MGTEQDGRSRLVTPSDEALFSRIEHTHRTIVHFYLKELAAARDLDRIRTLVEPLPELLSEHFGDEEGPNGLYEELRSMRPAVDSELTFLRKEHQKILRAVRNLQRELRDVEQMGETEQTEEQVARIKDETSTFMEMVRRHERTETRLVADIYYTEDGGSG